MNLYMVYPKDYDWSCFVIAENRNRAKVLITGYFHSDDHYTDYRVRTLTKGIGDKDMVIDSPDAEGYDLVLAAGFEYQEDEE